MPENASLDTLKRQRCATASSTATSPYSPSGCPTQLTNKSKLQMSVRHVRVGGRPTCTCVCVCALHISLRRRLCLILHFTCAIFCFEKPLLPAGSTTCQVYPPPHPWFCCCKLATTCCSCNSVCPIANENVRQLAPFALCMNNHALTYERLSLSLCVYVCVPINVCGQEGVRVCVCACVCLLAITTIANWQQNIPIAIACPENDDK